MKKCCLSILLLTSLIVCSACGGQSGASSSKPDMQSEAVSGKEDTRPQTSATKNEEQIADDLKESYTFWSILGP